MIHLDHKVSNSPLKYSPSSPPEGQATCKHNVFIVSFPLLKTRTIPQIHRSYCPQYPCSLSHPLELRLLRRCSTWFLQVIWSVSWAQCLRILFFFSHILSRPFCRTTAPHLFTQVNWACHIELRGYHGHFKLLREHGNTESQEILIPYKPVAPESWYFQHEIPLQFFDDTISLCSWIFCRYCGIKQVLGKNQCGPRNEGDSVQCNSKFKKLCSVQQVHLPS